MAKVDFAKAKADIAEIVEIVKTVPEALQQRCFELLFDVAFSNVRPVPEPKSEVKVDPPAEEKQQHGSDKKLPPNVLAFIHRHNVTKDDLGKLFMLEHDPLLPIYKMPSGNVAKSQLTKVMMVLLENALLNNTLSAPYAELREALKDDGLHDGNLNKNLKRNHDLFRGAITKDGIDEDGTVELTGPGLQKLAEVIKELGQ
jgi:hypothetical protein